MTAIVGFTGGDVRSRCAAANGGTLPSLRRAGYDEKFADEVARNGVSRRALPDREMHDLTELLDILRAKAPTRS